MKKFLSLIMFSFFVVLTALSQNNDVKTVPQIPIDEETSLISYKGVIKELGTKDELYDRGLLWFNNFFTNPVDVIREKDKDNGRIKGIARLQIFSNENDIKVAKGNIEFTVLFETKEGRYRYLVTNFNLKQNSYFALEKWLNQKDPEFSEKCNMYLAQVDIYINDMIKNLEKEMKPKVKKSDNW